ncbi:hypothetical protein BAUCODRAFT_114891, partial [Baudoinia panamericana UAMH 10762]
MLKRGGSPADSERSKKKGRILTGKAAISKPISTDYDTDDARIITLKEQGFSDEYVADKLVEENRIRYVPKSIGARWLRLRKLFEQVENERLDDELSDWHIGEDHHLHESVKHAEKEFERDLKRLEDRKWAQIAKLLEGRLKRKKYSGKACRERFAGLTNGDALLPIELDPDQEGRERMREDRIAAAKALRAQHTTKAQLTEIEKQRRAKERKAEAQEKARISKTKERERKAAKLAKERVKVDRAAARIAIREAKKAATSQFRLEEQWQTDRQKAERQIYAKLTG